MAKEKRRIGSEGDTFRTGLFDKYSKDIVIIGPDAGDGQKLIMLVYFDDVDHARVERYVRRLVELLNRHWGDQDAGSAVVVHDG